MKPLAFAAAILAFSCLAGCQHGVLYQIVPLYPNDLVSGVYAESTPGITGGSAQQVNNRLELIPGKLDGHWFERRIFSPGSSTVDAVELMYCPLLKDGPTVCRTTLIWQRGTTNLLEGDGAK
jgi:hypothetical protein